MMNDDDYDVPMPVLLKKYFFFKKKKGNTVETSQEINIMRSGELK